MIFTFSSLNNKSSGRETKNKKQNLNLEVQFPIKVFDLTPALGCICKYPVNPWSRVTVHGRGYFFSLHTSAPCFLRLLTWGDVLPPLHSPALCSGERGRVSHAHEGLKKTRGESMLEEEAPCDRLPVDHGFIRIFTSQVMTVQV